MSRVWTRQPQGPVRLAPDIASDFLSCNIGRNQLIVNATSWTEILTAPVYDTGVHGHRINTTAAYGALTSAIDYGVALKASQTFIYFGEVTASSGAYGGLIGTFNGGSVNSLSFQRNGIDNGWSIFNNSSGYSLTGEQLLNVGPVCLVLTTIGGNYFAFVNGSLWGSGSGAATTTTSGQRYLYCERSLSGSYTTKGVCYLHAFRNEGTPPARAQEISAKPWSIFIAPDRRIWIQIGAAAGGTTTEATLSATVTASLLGSRAISVTRSAASATGAATTRAISTIKSATTTASSVLARAVAKIVSAATTTVATIANQVTSGAQTFYRELTAATAAGALALRQSNLTRSTTAAASALTLRAVGALRVATQTATATQTSIKVKLKELAATGVAASAALTRAVATTRLASAVLSASATLRVGVYLSVAASAVATRLAAVAHTFSVATATAAATVTTLKVKLKNLATDVVSTTATLTRQTLAQRVATLAGTATAQRAISSTLAATQPVTAVAVKAISKTLAVAASALATLVRQLLSGSFWSADRTYTIAAAPRTYTIAAAPRIYTV